MQNSLDRQLGLFLRKQRGDLTYARFARKLGIAASTLYRLERGEQSLTLGRLEQILKRLKCRLTDIFP